MDGSEGGDNSGRAVGRSDCRAHRATPAERLRNGHDFEPTNKWILFGHHFAAIAGPGPLVGPVLAAQFGYMPGALWILIGCVLGAAAYPMFLVPNAIAPGGLTGVATILNVLFHTPVGTVSLVMNIPLFIIGYRSMGHVFAFRSLVATVLFSLLIDWLPMPVVTNKLERNFALNFVRTAF